jgi:hypothetical protein
VRDFQETDRPFVTATFLRGLHSGNSWFNLIPSNIFMANYKKVINTMIDSERNKVIIACLPDDPDVILGYSILSSDFQTIHWVFVKGKWRRKGIGQALVPKFPQAVTNITDLGKELLPKISPAIFNPFAL